MADGAVRRRPADRPMPAAEMAAPRPPASAQAQPVLPAVPATTQSMPEIETPVTTIGMLVALSEIDSAVAPTPVTYLPVA